MPEYPPPELFVIDSRLFKGGRLGALDDGGSTLAGRLHERGPTLVRGSLQAGEVGLMSLIDLPPGVLEPVARLLASGVEVGTDLPFDAEDLGEGAVLHRAQPARLSWRSRSEARARPSQSSPYPSPHNPQLHKAADDPRSRSSSSPRAVMMRPRPRPERCLAMPKQFAALALVALSANLLTPAPAVAGPERAAATRLEWLDAAAAKAAAELVASHGEAARARAERGVRQVASLWREEDGDAAEFEALVRRNFAADQARLDTMFGRMDALHEQMDGSILGMLLAFRWQTDLDLGPVEPYDELFAAYDPAAHLNDDFFANKLAFAVLLNFPLTTLEEKLRDGPAWTPRQWAEARLADRYARRVPAAVSQQISTALSAADNYIASYNIWTHHLLDERGERLFPAGQRLITHWNLRDELKAQYSAADGLRRQRLIAQVMERIVTQTIPAAVVDNPHVDWAPLANTVAPAAVQDSDRPRPANLAVVIDREPDTRYERLLDVYRAVRLADPYSPTAPTYIARRFEEDRELPEARVERMLVEVLSSPLVPRVARLIEARLGRRLEPFDIWYNGFRPRGAYTEAQLDEITRRKYPTAAAFAADMPNILAGLGFSAERARYLAERIEVDPSRGAGHAWGAARRGDKARLRTRVGANGMDYKGYNIAVHEFGHNVEQTFSLYEVPFHSINGVPNTAFTEALAFVFQDRDLELLGLAKPDATSDALGTLDDFWGAYEISGVALVDMRVWRWMYAHPAATPAELREATLKIARDVWNEFYAKVFGSRDVVLLAVYSHMISNGLYLPDYPIGHLIALQIKEQVRRTGDLGGEFERMTRQGRLTPDLWMQRATGAPVGPAALLAAAERALATVQK